jgi:hypothetical protein
MSPRARPSPERALLLALALFLGACRSSERFREPAPDLPAPLSVTLSPELRHLEEEASFPGFQLTFKIGYLLGPLFTAADGKAFLSLVDSDFEIEGQARPWPARYALLVDLQQGGAMHRIDARAEAESEESPLAAGRAAIERCVLEVHRQARDLLGARP